jgi:16S rRNA (cytidine1402-2'-O)-methyltransferase
MTTSTPGCLHVVATPIGNLDDLSPRALRCLAEADLICAEDTRHSQQLLAAKGLKRPLMALHDHNEESQIATVLERLQAGQQIALVSDAGTPLISDPGFRLVRAARAAGLKVSPLPGPSALIAALSVAGLAADRFAFEGFLPAKSSARRERLQGLLAESRTLVFYESSHRILECLQDAAAVFGAQRPAVIARELTKLFETVLDGDLGRLINALQADPNQQRGEFVLIIEGAPEDADAALREGQRIFAALREHLPASKAARIAAELSGAPRKALYSAVTDESA